MGTSEPVRAPPEVSRTRGHKLAKSRSDRIVVEFRARDLGLDDGSWRQDHGIFFRCQTSPLKYSYMLGGMFSSCACAMCLRTVSEYWKRSPQMRQCHWSRAKMYGCHSGLFGSSLGLGIFKSCKKNRNYHSGRADYDSGDRAGPGACHGFREVAKSGAQPEPARPRSVRRLCVAPAFGLRPRARLRPRLCTTLVTRCEDQSASIATTCTTSQPLADHCNFRDGSKQSLH